MCEIPAHQGPVSVEISPEVEQSYKKHVTSLVQGRLSCSLFSSASGSTVLQLCHNKKAACFSQAVVILQFSCVRTQLHPAHQEWAEATNLSVLSVLRTHRRNCRAALPSLNTSVSLSFTLRFTAILVLVRLTQHAVPQPHIPLETDVTEPRSNWCQPRRREPLDHFLASDHFNLFDCRVKSSHACVCRTQPATVPPLKRP